MAATYRQAWHTCTIMRRSIVTDVSAIAKAPCRFSSRRNGWLRVVERYDGARYLVNFFRSREKKPPVLSSPGGFSSSACCLPVLPVLAAAWDGSWPGSGGGGVFEVGTASCSTTGAFCWRGDGSATTSDDSIEISGSSPSSMLAAWHAASSSASFW